MLDPKAAGVFLVASAESFSPLVENENMLDVRLKSEESCCSLLTTTMTSTWQWDEVNQYNSIKLNSIIFVCESSNS